MEFNILVFSQKSQEWKKNILLINEKDFQIKNDIQNKNEEDKQIHTYSLINAVLIDNKKYDCSKENSIFIGNSSYNIIIKPINNEEKPKIISELRKIINNNFSYNDEIKIENKNDNNIDKIYETISCKLNVIQNILNLTKNIMENNSEDIIENNDNKKIDIIKNNIDKLETQLDIMMINFYNYHNLIKKSLEIDYSFEEEIISSTIYGDDIKNNFEILNPNIYHENDLSQIGKIIRNSIYKESSNYEDASSMQKDTDRSNNKENDKFKNKNKEKNNFHLNDINNNSNEFYNVNYDTNKIRKKLKKPLTLPQNMVKEMVTSFTQKKKSLPVYFNEPLSMGQKQCEKFYYLDLLNKAAHEEKKEMQLCYISAFIIGEIFLNIGRTLKPFNPIIGETYEYYNNNLNFRYYSEQVSHKPPVNAFVGETSNFILYGDTLGDTSFKLFKGGMELSFSNKIHILLKKYGDHYTYIPPNAIAKGLMKPPLYVDYYGDVLIENEKNPAYKCELKFIEESWTPNSLGNFEGTVYNNDKIIYLLGGNWKNEIYMTDPDGNNKQDLLILDQKLEYLNNTSECYHLPEFTCDLNNLTEELENSLPLNDSRFKKDIRFLEEGNVDEAQKYKEKYEEKQRKELNNDSHKILFFKEEYDSENEKKYYVPNGQYWEMKKNNTLKDNCNANIFDVSNY